MPSAITKLYGTGIVIPAPNTKSAVAGEDLTNGSTPLVTLTTGYMCYPVKLTTIPTAPALGWTSQACVIHVSATTDTPIGVLQNIIKNAGPLGAGAAGDSVEYAGNGGGARVLLGYTASPGDLLEWGTSGALLYVAGSNNFYFARVLEAGVAGDIVACEVFIGRSGS